MKNLIFGMDSLSLSYYLALTPTEFLGKKYTPGKEGKKFRHPLQIYRIRKKFTPVLTRAIIDRSPGTDPTGAYAIQGLARISFLPMAKVDGGPILDPVLPRFCTVHHP